MGEPKEDDGVAELDTVVGAAMHLACVIGEIGPALSLAAMIVDIRRRHHFAGLTVEDVLGATRLDTLVRHATKATGQTFTPLALCTLVNAAIQAAPKVGADVLREAVASIASRMPCTQCNGLRYVKRSGQDVRCDRCGATGIDPVQTRSEGDG
jgi:hypothetical protein